MLDLLDLLSVTDGPQATSALYIVLGEYRHRDSSASVMLAVMHFQANTSRMGCLHLALILLQKEEKRGVHVGVKRVFTIA